MKIDLKFDTSDMTKEERLDVQRQLQSALDQLKFEIRNMTRAEHVHFGVAGPDIFFGITFNFESMSKNELQDSKKTARRLIVNFKNALNPFYTNKNALDNFFGKDFDFSKMSVCELREGLNEIQVFLKKVNEQLDFLEKFDQSSRQEPH